MAASDYVPIFFKNRLHLAGRPQMSSRPNLLVGGLAAAGKRAVNGTLELTHLTPGRQLGTDPSHR